MAHLEDLISEVEPPDLRGAISEEIRQLKRRLRFGLVFERHMPETSLLSPGAGIRVGDEVRLCTDALVGGSRLIVEHIEDGKAVVRADDAAERTTVDLADLLVVKAFGESIYPSLKPIGHLLGSRGSAEHLVIKGENFHALQLLELTYTNKVDCIYIDPPYNTGAPDWKYNNRYIDNNDRWRHSKWLSMMERRLRLARRLLKPDSVLIVTVDEHEVSHLGVLLEQLFRDATRQMVTIVNNPKGVTEERLSRVEEYAYFCFFGDAVVNGLGDDLLTPMDDDQIDLSEGERPRWKGLLRSGANSRREDRKSMFYPILIDSEAGAILGTGEPLDYGRAPRLDAAVDGAQAVWPIRSDGSFGRWSVGRQTLGELIEKGYVRLGRHDPKRNTWAISYLSRRLREQIDAGVLQEVDYDKQRNVIDVAYIDPRLRRVKRVWHRSTHDAGAAGSDLLRNLLGGERRFAFPKSLYAVRDTLASVVKDNPEAVILDFFAGSATTLHATAYLNAEDGGCRRCIAVTNNEVSADEARALAAKGYYRGHPEVEREGVFEAVARPRVEAALSGRLPDGSALIGSYVNGRDLATGFPDGCRFMELEYLNPSEVELGERFDALHPLIWLMAGGNGTGPGEVDSSAPYVLRPDCGYGLLFDPVALAEFESELNEQSDIDYVFLFTDSEQAYADMASSLRRYETMMLPRDYLRHFRSASRA
ncbi:MAG TPA: DNA methyltransferase [Solirubrobacterales bacterium]|nr:DNA methyltransferase [Solirubrobacterales bacterium]